MSNITTPVTERITPKAIINEKRLWDDLMAIADITCPELPYTRRSFSPLFIEGRKFLTQRFEAAGLSVRIDAGGNLIGSLPGSDPTAGTIMIGSHSDTVPGGGRFDGVAGVIAALEIARSFKEQNQQLRHTIEVVDFLAEEPSEYGLSCIGSRAMSGFLDDAMLRYTNANGETLAQAITRTGGNPTRIPQAIRRDVKAFFELHIEQGPVLEAEKINIGIVSSIVKIRRIEIRFEGEANHAGTTPMHMRRDASIAAAKSMIAIQNLAQTFAASGQGHFVATTGVIDIQPNAANVIPSHARIVIDARSESDALMETFFEALDNETSAIAHETNVTRSNLNILSDSIPAACDQTLRKLLEKSAQNLSLSTRTLASGAGHDAAFLARIAPSAMVFIPCRFGRSHASEEWAEPEAIANGAATIATAILRLDQQDTLI